MIETANLFYFILFLNFGWGRGHNSDANDIEKVPLDWIRP